MPATFTVNNPLDVIDANPALTSLREAITDANAIPTTGQHTITFAAALTGQTITLNSQLPALEKNIYIAGLGSNNLTITRNAAMGNFRLLEVKSGSVSTIAGLKLTNGLAAVGEYGGAILSAGNLIITECVIQHNEAARGGGIATAKQELPGGGMLKSVLTIYNTVITGNLGSMGGGVLVSDCTATMYSTSITANTGNLGGGGIYVPVLGEFASSIELNDSHVISNGTMFDGGGIYCGTGELRLNGGTITCNWATNDFGRATAGGGVFLAGGTVAIATNNPMIAYNIATTGDGMYISLNANRTGVINYIDDSEFNANPV